MRNTANKFILGAAAAATIVLPLTVHAADATSFNPTTVKVTAKPISSIPVGTIISWPVAQNPADWQNPDGSYNWLECNGQNFSQAAYPELFAVLGGQVPDLRGRVTWGDATPGQMLEASLPNIRGSFVYAPSMHDWNIVGREDGAFSFEGSLPSDKWSSLDYQDQPRSPYRLSFSAERSSPIYKDGVQTVQPPAYTVRYLVRARP